MWRTWAQQDGKNKYNHINKILDKRIATDNQQIWARVRNKKPSFVKISLALKSVLYPLHHVTAFINESWGNHKY